MSSGDKQSILFRERIFPVLFMFIVTAVFIALVSGLYLGTRETVLRNEKLYLKRAVLFAAGIPVPTETAELETDFSQRIREVPAAGADGASDGSAYYEVLDASGAVSGYVIPATGPGLWGEIEAIVGFDVGLSTFTGVDFTKQNETPGLGGRIVESWFREQFRGKRAPLTRVPEDTEGESTNEFDAITGATATSAAVQNILNATQARAADVVGGGR